MALAVAALAVAAAAAAAARVCGVHEECACAVLTRSVPTVLNKRRAAGARGVVGRAPCSER